jgi:hypothetical protein
MTTSAPAPAQMPLGDVPAGWLATTNPDGTQPVYKMGRDAAGSVTGHAYGEDPNVAGIFVLPPDQLAVTVYAMPDPADTAAETIVSTFPSAAQISTAAQAIANAAPAQAPLPESGQAAALSPLVRATVALFDPNTLPAVAGAPELAEAFRTAAFAVSRGPRGPRTIEALNRLLDARNMAVLALFEPNA